MLNGNFCPKTDGVIELKNATNATLFPTLCSQGYNLLKVEIQSADNLINKLLPRASNCDKSELIIVLQSIEQCHFFKPNGFLLL